MGTTGQLTLPTPSVDLRPSARTGSETCCRRCGKPSDAEGALTVMQTSV